jgi:hypothetical protein
MGSTQIWELPMIGQRACYSRSLKRDDKRAKKEERAMGTMRDMTQGFRTDLGTIFEEGGQDKSPR